jgi:hypothetical protein
MTWKNNGVTIIIDLEKINFFLNDLLVFISKKHKLFIGRPFKETSKMLLCIFSYIFPYIMIVK